MVVFLSFSHLFLFFIRLLFFSITGTLKMYFSSFLHFSRCIYLLLSLMNMCDEHIFLSRRWIDLQSLSSVNLRLAGSNGFLITVAAFFWRVKVFFPLFLRLFILSWCLTWRFFDSVSDLQHGRESSHNGERRHVNASANTTEEKNIPSHHGDSFSLTWENILHLK